MSPRIAFSVFSIHGKAVFPNIDPAFPNVVVEDEVWS
jgi:hypothetical protein